jgi:secreted PhoX family phosphatase
MIVVNSEYTNRPVNLPHAPDGVPTGLDDVRILQHLQGVSVMEIAEGETAGALSSTAPTTAASPQHAEMTFDGPAAGHDLLKTDADPTGMLSLGTMNNCGSGRTPWGTYLTCEENFNGYFGSTEEAQDQKPLDVSVGFQRYGIGADGWGYDYHKWDARFDTSVNPTSRTASATSWRSTRRPRPRPRQAHRARPFQARERGLCLDRG